MSDIFLHIEPINNSQEYSINNTHNHGQFEIIWFTKVEKENCTIQIDFVEYPIVADRFYIISSNQFHRMDRTGVQGLVISMSKDFYYATSPVDMFQCRGIFSINSIINQKKCTMCHTMIGLITEEYNGDCRYLLLEAYFKALFIHLVPIYILHQPKDSDRKRVSTLMDLIEENYKEHKDVSFYSDLIGLSEKGLNDVCKKITEKTVKSLINERLLIEMKRDICRSNKPVKEIAYELGFKEPSYFCRLFKQKTGLTPEAFKDEFNS